jgi:hypothetical protein
MVHAVRPQAIYEETHAMSSTVRLAQHLQAAADAVRIGVGYTPAPLASLLAATRDVNQPRDAFRALDARMDAVWLAVESAWDRVLRPDRTDLFYEIWSDRFAAAHDALAAAQLLGVARPDDTVCQEAAVRVRVRCSRRHSRKRAGCRRC